MSTKFNQKQLEKIKLGFENGLTVEQVGTYADVRFNYSQMEQIRLGYENGLTDSQVKVYAKPTLSWLHMDTLRKAWEKIGRADIMEKLAMPGYSYDCLDYLIELYSDELHRGRHDYVLAVYDLAANPAFNLAQMKEIVKGIGSDTLRRYAKPVYSAEQMEEIRLACSHPGCMRYEKPEFSAKKMKQIRLGYKNDLTDEMVAVYAKTDFQFEQMEEIRLGFEHGLSYDMVLTYAYPKIDRHVMWQMRIGYENGLPVEKVARYAKSEFKPEKMGQIRLGYESGLTDEQVEIYANNCFSANQMEEIRLGFENGLTLEQILVYAKAEVHNDIMFYIRCKYEEGLTLEKANEIANYKIPRIELLWRSLIVQICECINLEIDKSIIEDLIERFHYIEYKDDPVYSTPDEIHHVYSEKLSLCLECYLRKMPKDEIALLTSSDFSYEQMKEIESGLLSGLSTVLVELYAKKKLSADEMKQRREEILKMKKA